MLDKPGVYCFWHGIPTELCPEPTGKVYVGSAQDLRVRLNNHFTNCSSNKYLQNAIAKYGLNAFHISQVETESHAEALFLEQMCLDYIFANDLPKYNIAVKVGGGKVLNNYSNHKKSCELGGGSKAIKRFAIDLTTNKIYEFGSLYAAENCTGVLFSTVAQSCKNGKPYIGNNTRWIFSKDRAKLLLRANNLTAIEKQGRDRYKFILFNGVQFSEVFNSICKTKLHPSHICTSLKGSGRPIVSGHIILILELNGNLIADPLMQYKTRFNKFKITKKIKRLLKLAENFWPLYNKRLLNNNNSNNKLND